MNQSGSPTPPQLVYIVPLDFADDLFDRWDRGVDMSLSSFCNKLHSRRSKAFNYGVASIQHWKGPCTNEFLILDVIQVPLIPRTINTEINRSHTYIKVSRSEDHAGSSFIWRRAKDEVVILRKEDEAAMSGQGNPASQGSQHPAGKLLETLSWGEQSTPTLLDIFSLITFVSVSLPYYNIFTCESNWLVRTVCSVAKPQLGLCAYQPWIVRVWEAPDDGNKLWKIAKFLISIPSRLLTPGWPMGLPYFCGYMYHWSGHAKRQQWEYLEQ